MSTTGRSRLREVVRNWLRDGRYDAVLKEAGANGRLPEVLLSLLYDADELVAWRAVTALGKAAARYPEAVRPLVGRLIWWMNDESGGIGWFSPQALAEIGRQAPALLGDAARVVINYRQEPPLIRGVMWAIGRLAPVFPGEAREVVPELEGLLDTAESELRGVVIWTLGEIGDPRARAVLERYRDDQVTVSLYEDGRLEEKKTGAVAREALAKLRGTG